MSKNLWTEWELMEVLKLYCRTPFGRLHRGNPDIITLAVQLGRTPSAIALKAVNFANLDPTIDRKGMKNVSALDKEVWDRFFADIENYIGAENVSKNSGLEEGGQSDYTAEMPMGNDVFVTAKARKNQDFFREMILASYDSKCALSAITEPALLIASHIVPWSVDASLRINPNNGICLNSLHDRAFDKGLISFSDELTTLYSSQLPLETASYLHEFGAETLTMPKRFRPALDFLNYHRIKIFKS